MKIQTQRILSAVAMLVSAAGSYGQGPANLAPQFTHPKEITNPYLPLASLKQRVLESTEKGKPLPIERILKPGSKIFSISGQLVEALIVEDREMVNGELAELTLDYFAQDDEGTVYHLGEDVDQYKDGKVVGHEGAWLFGRDTQELAIVMPGHPRVGQKFRSESVPGGAQENVVVLSISEKIRVPAGKFKHCLKVRETNSHGETEYKIYAPGVGAVREEDATLKSHR